MKISTLLLSVLLFTSCSKEELSRIEGTWVTPEKTYPLFKFQGGDISIHFSSETTASYTGTYTIRGGDLTIDLDQIPEAKVYSMTLTESSLDLEIKRGSITTSYPYAFFNLVRR